MDDDGRDAMTRRDEVREDGMDRYNIAPDFGDMNQCGNGEYVRCGTCGRGLFYISLDFIEKYEGE